MAYLYSKHFGDKVFLKDLNNKVVEKMLIIPQKDKKNKVPNFGILIRFKNNTVGLAIQWIDSKGYSRHSYEHTNHYTISSWADFHTNSKIYINSEDSELY